MSIKFKNREHEKFYEQCLTQTGSLDPYDVVELKDCWS